ncbi:MAG: hypothetical protein LBD93_07045 [Treponema sp.]|nr:hypothetical protein [Treponema sp.]
MRILLFVGELFRLFLLLGAFTVLGPLYEISGGGVFSNRLFPYVVYVVPNALFPLMTYFLWIRLSLYRSYIPLYIAGKTITLVSLMGWVFFSFQGIIAALNRGTRGILGFTLLLIVADIFSVLGGALLQTKISRMNRLVAQVGGGI